MSTKLSARKANFGTAPVFLTAISTILGAIMFLRFGYAVGNVGFLGTIGIIVIGHLVTIPTAMAIAELATNQKVEGGGEYYIISRSFGLNIGGAIGLALFFSQAISVAFYIIAFAEAFDPVIAWLKTEYNFIIPDKRFISVPSLLLLVIIMLTKGASIGMKVLYVVVVTLIVALVAFFIGKTGHTASLSAFELNQTVSNPDSFFVVFAIVFPAFTGMTAGVGLSGDLKNPAKSIPIGTLAATLVGMIVYGFIAFKLSWSATPQQLNDDQLVMSSIAGILGPIIPIGLAAACLSSALGSIMVAPRTLQALGGDKVGPSKGINRWLARGTRKSNEPVNSSIIVGVIAVGFIMMGSVDVVARVISMFFMVTYGALCTISFLQHFSADPSYRPIFRSKWYISLLGAVMCIYLMFKMDFLYAFLALVVMVLLYLTISAYKKDTKSVATLFRGVVYQFNRRLHVFLQKAERESDDEGWRPALVCVSSDSFKRFDAFEMLKWISHRYGFGTYIHHIEGYVSRETNEEANDAHEQLINLGEYTKSKVYIDTIISPSYTSAIAQIIQLPGFSGKDNNMIMFEYNQREEENLEKIMENFPLVKSLDFDVCMLASSDKKYGYMRTIHVWLSPYDLENANLMILMAYIILGHPDWRNGEIKIFAVFPADELDEQRNSLSELVRSGRLPISAKNIELIPKAEERKNKDYILEHSHGADLTIVGFRTEMVKAGNTEFFLGYDEVGNVLFVNSGKRKHIG